MASEKQIAANRRNARNSTGPKTKAGKKRASHNALRHGLASQGLRAIDSEHVDQLAREIAGDSQNPIVLELARCAAAAELDLARVRQVRADLIARVFALGSLTPQRFFRTWKDELRWLVAQDYLKELARRNQRPAIPLLPPPEPINPAAPMPEEISERLAEAVKRLLPELRSTYSYEQRAAGRRDRAIREISRHTMRLSQLTPKC
jgi:hypothetical protein